MKTGSRTQYVYVDYEPPEDARFPHPATYKEIAERVSLEHGLKASNQHIKLVMRKHGILKRGKPLPEGADLPEVPAGIEEAIEDALRHFNMIT